MKIVRLTAENIKRIRAIEITPDGTVQIVTGRNAQGKTSVLDAIWLALGGGAASKDTPRPIRDGEDHASVELDLGDLIVTRTWDAEKGKTELRVTAPDGSKYRTPQTLLDGLVGKLSFDPLAFTRLTAREQRQALLDLLDLDFTAEDAERQRLYDLRLETGRQAHAFGDLPKLDKGAPVDEVSVAAIVDQIQTAMRQRSTIDGIRHAIKEHLAEIGRIDEQIATLQISRANIANRIAANQEELDGLAEPADTDALRAELAGIEERNKVARENRRIVESREKQKALDERYTELGRAIAAIDDTKAATLAAVRMPVDGLGFDEQGVTYNGVPFAQASSAEQIRVSLAMAMALNPALRVIRILDGSLLDADSMAAIAAQARANDYQVWVERVEDDSPAAVLIEDGQAVER